MRRILLPPFILLSLIQCSPNPIKYSQTEQLPPRAPAQLMSFIIKACGELHIGEKNRYYIALPASAKKTIEAVKSLIRLPRGPLQLGFLPENATEEQIKPMTQLMSPIIRDFGHREGHYFCFKGMFYNEEHFKWVDQVSYEGRASAPSIDVPEVNSDR